jgi:hypothetical protein
VHGATMGRRSAGGRGRTCGWGSPVVGEGERLGEVERAGGVGRPAQAFGPQWKKEKGKGVGCRICWAGCWRFGPAEEVGPSGLRDCGLKKKGKEGERG